MRGFSQTRVWLQAVQPVFLGFGFAMISIGSIIGFHVPIRQVNKISSIWLFNIYTKIWHSIMINTLLHY